MSRKDKLIRQTAGIDCNIIAEDEIISVMLSAFICLRKITNPCSLTKILSRGIVIASGIFPGARLAIVRTLIVESAVTHLVTAIPDIAVFPAGECPLP